jgi:hypothetical protein
LGFLISNTPGDFAGKRNIAGNNKREDKNNSFHSIGKTNLGWELLGKREKPHPHTPLFLLKEKGAPKVQADFDAE